ncbi:Prephenate dehydratase-domain-containing protein [Suillus clintonianus]|uniref:Prephenate dehydratase-domain-containing protein n=1 Tax=Suillus clintonianus TaxID=1904413 RepID=UPI001B88008E|nr:Prephenate dehydratase-domain-containing protein [Suillus clintonianus]KAG2118423.1 Prephenate dehydratase-domain-containing protein [Suillus clintonianus]
MLDTLASCSDEVQDMPALVFLGPPGTYSHQAAFDAFGDSVRYVAKQTIAGVFESLSSELPYGIIPQENSTNGSVIETYNLLRCEVVGQDSFVRGETNIPIKHSLVVRQNVKIEDIEHVLSHEQALGQCKAFLKVFLPGASLVPTDSTASAARALLNPPSDGFDPLKSAAICSTVVTSLFPGLEVLRTGIQDGASNTTRFYIVSYGADVRVPWKTPSTYQKRALIRVLPDRNSVAWDSSRAIKALNMPISRIDRRPSLRSTTFHDVYFLEVYAEEGKDSDITWSDCVNQAVERLRQAGLESTVLGVW